jgi:hypothetical protein
MNATEPRTSFSGNFPANEDDRLEIRNQLERILAHPQFQNSRRYPALLRYVVEKTLEGNGASLKERTIGIKVFGREPSYDTNLDHTVRTSAGEVRKRLAQYYVESDREGEIRIDLPAGSYVPQFRHRRPEKVPGLHIEESGAETLAPPEINEASVAGRPLGRGIILSAIGLAILIVAGIAWTRGNWPPQSALDQFWTPISASAYPITLCIGPPLWKEAANGFEDSVAPPTLREVPNQRQRVAFFDAVTLARLTAFLAVKGKTFRALYAPQISLADLRQGPAILIGAFNNDWTLLLTGPLRYRFQRDAEFHITSIRDEQNPSRNDWKVDRRTPDLDLTEDYSIVSRVSDPTTGETVIVAAGITKYGTMAAGEFLTSSRLNELTRYAPRDWRRKNLQVVLATKVVKGSPGPPRVLAAYFW